MLLGSSHPYSWLIVEEMDVRMMMNKLRRFSTHLLSCDGVNLFEAVVSWSWKQSIRTEVIGAGSECSYWEVLRNPLEEDIVSEFWILQGSEFQIIIIIILLVLRARLHPERRLWWEQISKGLSKHFQSVVRYLALEKTHVGWSERSFGIVIVKKDQAVMWVVEIPIHYE